MLRNSILPWFAEAGDPDLVVASRAGDYTNSKVALVEWLASRNRPDLVAAYAQRLATAFAVWALDDSGLADRLPLDLAQNCGSCPVLVHE
jgi:hypothetical protein